METGVLLRLLRANWLLIILLTLLGCAAGFGLARYEAPKYTGSSQLFVTVSSSSSTGDLAQGSDYSQQQARNYAAVATREIVLQPVIDRLGLNMTVAELRHTVSTSVPLNTSVITITATDASAGQAADIANAIATSLVTTAKQLAPTVSDFKTSPVRLQMIESATPSDVPSSPNLPLMVFLGALGGLTASVIVVVLRELVGATVRTKEQLAEIVDASVLGGIRYDRQAARQPMALLQDPYSGRSEDYRQVRAGLRFLQTETRHKVFVITSASATEGKSSVAANVASAIAASGTSVCLVEADLRRPSLGATLDLVDGIGLTTVLAGDATVDDVLQEWGDDGLCVMLAGEIPPNPSELLESVGTEAVLTAVRDRFDVTIIDCPPLNPVADAAVLARVFGGAVLVAATKKVKVRDLRRAVERLQVVDAPILGTILNMASGGDPRYYHGQKNRQHTRRPAPPPPVNGSHLTPESIRSSESVDEYDARPERALAPKRS